MENKKTKTHVISAPDTLQPNKEVKAVVITQENFISEMVNLTRSKLGRSEGAKVTNTAVNSVGKALRDKEVKTMQEMYDLLKSTKPAKSIQELCDNIALDKKAGTRSDQSALDTDTFSFTFKA